MVHLVVSVGICVKHLVLCFARSSYLININLFFSVVGRIMSPPPPRGHSLILRTCEYGTLHGKKDFAHVIKFRIWDGKIILDYLGA